MAIPTPPSSITVRAIQLTTNLQLWIKVLPRLFGSKTRNYRRLYLDIALYSNRAGSITFNVLRLNPYNGAQTAVVTNHQVTFSESGTYTTKIDVEATHGGFWIYSLHVDGISGSPVPTVHLTGLWVGIDEYYNYGSDTV